MLRLKVRTEDDDEGVPTHCAGCKSPMPVIAIGFAISFLVADGGAAVFGACSTACALTVARDMVSRFEAMSEDPHVIAEEQAALRAMAGELPS